MKGGKKKKLPLFYHSIPSPGHILKEMGILHNQPTQIYATTLNAKHIAPFSFHRSVSIYIHIYIYFSNI